MDLAMKNNRGFTLVELMVAMGLFVIILMITGRSFDSVLSQSSKLFRAEESNIEGVIGLEMLRHDLQQAGLGLYTEVPEAISEQEQEEAASAPASTYNDYPDNHVPRPIAAGNSLSTTAVGNMTVASSILAGTDYLVIRATTVGFMAGEILQRIASDSQKASKPARRWSLWISVRVLTAVFRSPVRVAICAS